MSKTQISRPALLARPEAGAATTRGAPPAVQTCLIVSISARRARLLARAAQNEHWSTIVCHNADEALRQATRQRIELALVDLQSAQGEQADGLRRLVEQLATRHLLLAVCGHADDQAGEVWSRKLGVWTYLPGVDRESEVALVCAEARNVIDKMNGRLGPTKA